MPKPKASEDWGDFVDVEDEPARSIIIRSYGWDKTGKNHFGYTMPGPIAGLYLDPAGTKGVVEKFIRGDVDGIPAKTIKAIQYRFNKKFDDQDKACELRDRWIADYATALKVARSIQWDETETWELFRFAEFGRESGLQRDYGPLNGMYRGLIQDAFDAGVNLQLIQKVKVKYKNDKATDELAPQGFQMAGNIVQVSLEHRVDENNNFWTKIVNARQNTDVWGLEEKNLTFPQLAVLLYPDTSEDDWL